MIGLVDVVEISRSKQWGCSGLTEQRRRCSRFCYSQSARSVSCWSWSPTAYVT